MTARDAWNLHFLHCIDQDAREDTIGLFREDVRRSLPTFQNPLIRFVSVRATREDVSDFKKFVSAQLAAKKDPDD